ncbi:MAG: hypothetical protein JKY45_05635, partial [Emcibacter sp.]|nr:hypothetical protein [Emcibacter sp.]
TPLPIDAVLPQLTTTLRDNPFAILVAAPGAGKTTRVPLSLLDADWRAYGRIIMLEPRRIAARASAHWMAQSRGEKVGETVGYRVRLDTRVSDKTQIEVVTEGVFTRMILDDPELNGVAIVIFDEFHERSLDGDLGLARSISITLLSGCSCTSSISAQWGRIPDYPFLLAAIGLKNESFSTSVNCQTGLIPLVVNLLSNAGDLSRIATASRNKICAWSISVAAE